MPSIPPHSLACTRCAERKVKCDRQQPCSACAIHKVNCVLPPPRLPRKRPRHVNNQTLVDRLQYYETLLRERGIDPGKLPSTPGSDQQHTPNPTLPAVLNETESSLPIPSSNESETSGSVSKTQVIHGQGRSMFVDNSLWSRVVEEFHDPENALTEYSSSDPETSDDDFGFVLGSTLKSNIRPRHPPPERIHQLWQIFMENVDPLTKVVHVPTLQPAIQKAANDIEAIPQSLEALMFAIYSAAVMSLSDDECQQRLCASRKTLLSRHMTATRAALSRARFMGTTSIVVLQALVLHIISVRDIYEPRAVWSLTGIAVRIAQGMGLERDGTSLCLSPFETEIRRRIWWLLRTHDYRMAELCGLPKFRDLDMGPDSTKRPTNANDDQLFPSMTSSPLESAALTDVAFVTLKYELANFAAGRVAKFRLQGKGSSQWDQELASGGGKTETDEAGREIEGLLETKYLRYCDPSQPFHLMMLLMARSAIHTIRFLTHHPRRWASMGQTPLSERQWVWQVSIQLLEQHSMLQSNPQLQQFAWHAAFVMPWHAFIHVLDTLRANPLLPDAEKAWKLISKSPVIILDSRKPIHIAVGNLCLKAWGARAVALSQQGDMFPPPTPEFILQLRQRREVASAKAEAHGARSGVVEDPVLHRHDTLESSPHQGAPSRPGQPEAGGTFTEAKPPWFTDGFDDNQVMIQQNLDLMLAQEDNLGDNASHTTTINWEQWDTWLAESNTVVPVPLSDLILDP